MTGEDKRNAQALADQGTDQTSIGVMGMNPVDPLAGLTQVVHQLISELLEMGPEQFLAQIAPWTKRKTEDACTGGNGLLPLAVVNRQLAIVDLTGDHIDLIDFRPQGKTACQLQDVEGLTSGVGITAKLKIARAEQTVQMQMQQTQTHSGHLNNNRARLAPVTS